MKDDVLLMQTGGTNDLRWQNELANKGFEVRVCFGINEAADEIAEELPGILVMHIERGGVYVLDLMEHLGRNLSFPVIAILRKWDTKEVVAALEAGVNDVMDEQVPIEELSARIRGLIRLFKRFAEGYLTELVFEDLRMELKGRKTYRGEELIKLTPKEFDLLKYLAKRAGQVCQRDDILKEVWGYDFSTGTNVVDVYIRHLRKKIDKGRARKLIHTVRGNGYMVQ
ncbi:winged helix-turn-helix transcriptional regulator [Paenibacillus sp. DYY-L-2]|uniref:winged helix-turn-helix transcriptional regulator n=1 Tax=Paenibacillus sp. DYY-L-2 TaxID=3447013 RepID=UPI003F4F6E39